MPARSAAPAQPKSAPARPNRPSAPLENLDGLAAVLGSTGIVSKPGTVLIYKRLYPSEVGSPRVLTGQKHREGDLEHDLPATVLNFDTVTKRLSVAGLKEDITLRERGVTIIRVIGQAGGSMPWSEVMEAVEGRRENKLEALRLLTHPEIGVLTRTGVAKSKTDPLTLSLRTDLAGEPIEIWRTRFRLGSQRFPRAGNQDERSQTPVEATDTYTTPILVPGNTYKNGNQERENVSLENSEAPLTSATSSLSSRARRSGLFSKEELKEKVARAIRERQAKRAPRR